jgi:hypothetical protein
VQANATPLVSAKVDHGAQALLADLSHCGIQLLPAVAAPGSEGIAGEALRMYPNERNVAVAPSALDITQDECQMLSIWCSRVPMELESAVCCRQHGRHNPVYPLWFGHHASLT